MTHYLMLELSFLGKKFLKVDLEDRFDILLKVKLIRSFFVPNIIDCCPILLLSRLISRKTKNKYYADALRLCAKLVSNITDSNLVVSSFSFCRSQC